MIVILPPVSCADSPEGHTVLLRSTGAIAASVFCENLADASGTALKRLMIIIPASVYLTYCVPVKFQSLKFTSVSYIRT